MTCSDSPQELIKFPCHFEFKAFGPGLDESRFFDKVLAAVSTVVQVSRQAMRTRPSSGGKYQCVTVLVTLQNRSQLEAVYAALRDIDDLKYLL
ncbi:MAG: YbeD family protein [Desulfuromonadales bacterium]